MAQLQELLGSFACQLPWGTMAKSTKQCNMDAQARPDWKEDKKVRLFNAAITKAACTTEFNRASKKVASFVQSH